MNREIKFRAWDGERLRLVWGLGWIDGELDTVNTPKYHGPVDEDVSIMQYTGLKDKNGVEIYEGDVYHQGDPRITYTVVWHDSGLIGKQNRSSSFAGLSYWQDRIEIIGNIYEHTHLLEDKP